MRPVKIKDLPNGPWREYALEAQRRGIEILGADILNATDITLIGAIDMIRELTEKIEKKTE
jgi:hypothetical protein